MISEKDFIDYINEYKSFTNGIEEIDKVIFGKSYMSSLYECKWYDSVGKMLDIFLETHFTEDGCDLIYWWMFEDVNHIITDDENSYDVNDIRDLYKYLAEFDCIKK